MRSVIGSVRSGGESISQVPDEERRPAGLKEWIPRHSSDLIPILIVISLAAIFFIDIVTPPSFRVLTPYVLPLILTIWVRQRWAPFAVTGIAIVLIIIGFLLSSQSFLIDIVFDRVSFCLVLIIAAIGISTYTDQVRARQESSWYLRKIVDTAESLIFVKDREGRFLLVNQATARFFGTTVDEMIGKTDDEFRFLDTAEHLPHLHDENAEVIGNIKEVHSDAEIAGPDGQIHWFTTAKVPMLNPDGICDSVLVVATEITERKKSEESLKEYAGRLQRSNEDLQRFAYIASHDLQEPLRSIVSYSQMLDRRYRGKLDSDADEFLGYLVEGGLRMQMLIQDVLSFSCVNASEPQFTETDIGTVLVEVELGLDQMIRASEATITHDPLPMVMADRMQMVQLFTNLISNAVKFHRPGVVPMVYIRARKVGQFWEFSIADNGIGIEPEYFERIFVIFQRLHTRQEYEGTGIGLAIARRILDRHGGQIRVSSTFGRGTTFYFTLPAIAA